MAEPGFTSVPIEVPTAQLGEYETILCAIGALPITAGNAKKVAAKLIGEAVEQERRRSAFGGIVPLEPPK